MLASDDEYTDILYSLDNQEVTVNRDSSSLIKSCESFFAPAQILWVRPDLTLVPLCPSVGNQTEVGKLKLWPVVGTETLTLNLTVVVDNSAVEIFANDELAITTRAYPWLSASVGAGLLSANATGTPVQASGLQLWDGLIKAWPNRADNSSTGLVW